MNGNIHVFPQSKYQIGGRAFVFGETSAPRMRGGFEINNLSIPELLVDLRKAELKFKGHEADLDIADLLLNGSDIQNITTFSLLPA